MFLHSVQFVQAASLLPLQRSSFTGKKVKSNWWEWVKLHYLNRVSSLIRTYLALKGRHP